MSRVSPTQLGFLSLSSFTFNSSTTSRMDRTLQKMVKRIADDDSSLTNADMSGAFGYVTADATRF